jgi:nucleoside-diphosphate-sugar epimerase
MSHSGGHLSFISSGEVYGPTAPLPTKESDYSPFDHLALRGSYPELKRAGEVILKTWAQTDDFTAASLRVYHTFGPGMREGDQRIFSTLKSVLRGEDIILNSTGEATRSFLYVKDLVAAIRKTITESKFEEYNVASDTEITILEFAQRVAAVGEHTTVILPQVPPIGNSTRSPILRGLADTTKLKSTGWVQSVDLEQAISRTMNSMRWRAKNNFSKF